MTCFTRYAQDKTLRTTVREDGSSEAAGSIKEVSGIGSGLKKVVGGLVTVLFTA
jgi:hypothetical protein